jgi:hypothetical protein
MDYGENVANACGNRIQTWIRNPRQAEQFDQTLEDSLEGARVGAVAGDWPPAKCSRLPSILRIYAQYLPTAPANLLIVQ